MTFAEKLQELRKNNGLSQEQLAEQCNVSRQAVSKWESGAGYPEMEKVLQLCDILKVDLDYLMRDKATHSDTAVKESTNIYNAFVGKWVKILLNDKEYQGLYQAAVLAVNNHYIIFEEKAKRGILKTPDIKSMSNFNFSDKKLEKMQPIMPMEISNDYNPFSEFVGKNCLIRLKCSSFFSFPQGYYDAKIESTTEDGIVISQKGKSTAIKISDVLMIIEK
jgi:transcriptional regulator with XRE-family HTH domain